MTKLGRMPKVWARPLADGELTAGAELMVRAADVAGWIEAVGKRLEAFKDSRAEAWQRASYERSRRVEWQQRYSRLLRRLETGTFHVEHPENEPPS
jgi:hypothetical protein